MSAIRNSARLTAVSALALGGALLLVGPASAHVTLSPGEGHAGSYVIGTIAVPHGCEGSPTTKVAIKIPQELNEVTPTLNPLWTVQKKTVKLATPIKAGDGDEITERVDEVVYTAKTPLPDGYRDAFDLSFQVPDVAGKTLYFPTIQTCEKGQTAWVEIAAAGAGEPEHPAPAYQVLPAAPAGGDDATATIAPAAARTSSDDGDGSSGLAIAGLVAGVLGLGLGGTALARTRRQS